ncbi:MULTISPECIES: hypothetical protein [unclassified Streptomyces]|uniref:hypothetical protein n=1 Tax=unclassified Streptomyces TaxID=2593676 RepID=UPI000DBA10C5|nr:MULTISPECIES: hypothetical protein [unclassified Streptomyces]MYT71729.1 hypothetical protein [Streptomyces sp. SID8367]RAJ72562.1 hypothetical protein K377_07344 [Streptomyces sp. PsTaAH-137]
MQIHQVDPVAGWIPVAQPDRPLALSWNSGVSALILALAELLLLVWLLLRWLVHRQGGRRRAWRGLTRQIRLTGQAFSEPVREFLGFRAAIRRLTRLLASQDVAALAHGSLDGADRAARPDAAEAFGFAVTVRPATRRDDGRVAVRLAGRGLPRPGHPWETGDDPLVWHTSAVDAGRLAAPDEHGATHPPAGPRVLVPLGLSDDGAVFLDLLSGPRILSTYGDRRTTRDFVQAVAAHLDLPGGSAEVLVTHGVHPRFDGPDLDSVLDTLEAAPPEPARPVVVVCANPDDGQSARLSGLARAGALCAVVAGPMSAHRWEIRVDSRGRTETPGLGIVTDTAPLGPAAARTARSRRVRRDRYKAASVRPAGPPPPPAGPDPHGPSPDRYRPAPEPAASGTRPRPAPAAVPESPEPVAHGAPARRTAVARRSTAAARPATPAAVTPVPPPEPLAPAVHDLFAEPEITGVSAAGTSDAESFENPRETLRAERRNEP